MADKFETGVTPAGTGRYMWVNTPDTKFVAEGVYQLSLELEGDDAEEMRSLIELKHNEWVKRYRAENKGKKGAIKKEADLPINVPVDDDGEPTGALHFKFKQKAQIKSRTGEVIKMKVAIFDAQGTPMKGVPVYSGSTIKVAYEIIPYAVAATGVGISLRLKAVQVLELVSGDGGRADSYGFGAEEEGYQFSEDDVKEDSSETPDEKADEADEVEEEEGEGDF